jgi:ABC-type bacteriocin/lantibiotic exporters, contain an N-terminal double-glycine peptidase domain
MLYFRYPESENWTLRHFNLTIAAGEKLALVGINGAGKTTCIKLLTGLYQPTEGRILLDGQDISMMSREECYALFSVVFQDAMPLAMSLRENIALANEESTDEAKVEDCIERAGLATMVASLSRGANTELTRFLDEHGMDLSGGQTQRLMLARALYKNAPVILLDEPTAALDPIAEAEMYERYSQLVGFKTSVYISHRLASTRFCDRIAFLENGQLVEIGSHADLIAAKGKYAAMYLVQSQYYQEDYVGGEIDGE